MLSSTELLEDDGERSILPEAVRKHRAREWAHEDSWDVSGFDAEIPDPALRFPFELDPFQKRAVRRVERSEHVMVAAHTSAGKTVVAEYAVAHALQLGMRAIYTSPIKALSNQKFQEFTRRFEGLCSGSVGIVTGDVAVNPEASCVIMTTEILRSMLYRGDKGLNQVKWVIFDEVHYVNDADRGVVWEEVIILLPPEVSIVMLSATVPNYRDFAGWVGRTKRSPVYTVHTTYRPTPLRHFLSFRGHVIPLMDHEGFHSEAFQRTRDLQNEKAKAAPRPNRRVSVTFETRPFGMTPLKGEGSPTAGYVVDKVNHNDPSKPAARLGVKPGWIVASVAGEDVSDRSPDEVQQLTKQVELPVTMEFEVPVVSNRDQKEGAAHGEKRRGGQAQRDQAPQARSAPAPSRESRERTETLRLQALLRSLDAEDKLPATVFVFSRRRVEALAADMPNLDVCTAEERSKVHTFLKQAFERLTEADQQLPQVRRVAELAGRGVGIHHGGLLPVVKEAVELLFSRSLVKILIATETFAMGVNMPARSVIFTAWVKHDGAQRRALLPSEYTQMAGRAGRRGLDSEGHVFLLCGDEVPDQKQITRMMTSKAEPLASRFRVTFAMILQMKRFSQSGVQVEDLLGQSFLENARARRRPEARRHLKDRMQQLEALPAVQCILGEPDIEDYAAWEDEARSLGILLHRRLYESKSRDRIFCPGRLLRVFKADHFASTDAVVLELLGQRCLRVAVLLPLETSALSGRSVKLEESWMLQAEQLPLEAVLQIFEACVDPQSSKEAFSSAAASEADDGAAKAAALRVGHELLAWQQQGLQPLAMNKTLKQVEVEFYDTLLRQRGLQRKQENSKCHDCALKHQHYEQLGARRSLAADIEDLDRELGAESLGLLPQLRAKEQVLRDLECLQENGLISFKGQAAAEVLSGDEITVAEVVFHNILEGCTPQEVAAAVSAFVFPDKVEVPEDGQMEELPESLATIRQALLDQHSKVEKLLVKRRAQYDSEEFARSCNVALMGTAYRWACGETLATIMQESPFQEGAIVRAIVRAEELLRKLQEVAKMLGSSSLQNVFSEAADLIHRDIAFVPSLYIKQA
ncbi:unnamed protein product [Symbiodinium natans]|uniref:Superkiller viralicidic activity 2-like 2 n=1 Tax=Symbiodinium natans TaxID=878477 RepID=A0A812TVW1_9DINO|nr:unnamed protein product [Symbiodinium natans]